MRTSSRPVSPKTVHVSSVVESTSSQSISSENVSHQVPMQVFEGHKDQAICACFYPDENKLVTGSYDRTLCIWDLKTGAVDVWSGHTDWVLHVDVSRDAKTVVSGSADKTVRIWNGESGETMHVLEGHEQAVKSVEFSRDSTRVVSGSWDGSMRVWSVETGKLVFEPIQGRGSYCYCVRYSPSGDRIASGGYSVQIWDAETGSGILSIQNSAVSSVVWTADGTHLIGECGGKITIWDSHNGEPLRTWTVGENTSTIASLSLSPKRTHLATSNWGENRALVSDTSTGEIVAVFEHGRLSNGIAFSPSGRFIATACDDGKVYVWEAPAFGDPQTKAQQSRAPSFSLSLDQPAIPQGSSRNDEMDRFWDSQSDIHHHRNQQPSSQLQLVFNKVKDKFANFFARRPVVAVQTSSVRETIQVVAVAAGKDRPYAATIYPPRFNRVQKILYMIIHCAKPEEEDEEVPANTAANLSQAEAGNAATNNESERPHMVDDTENGTPGLNLPPAPAGSPVVCTQPERTAAMSLSGAENRDAGSHSFATIPESIEMVSRGSSPIPSAIPQNTTVPVHASPQPTPSTDPLSPAVTSNKPSSSTAAAVISAPLTASSNSVPPDSMHLSSQLMELQTTNTLSPEEIALTQEYRQLKDTSVAVPFRGPGRDRESYVRREPSITPAQSLRSVTPSTPLTAFPPSPQACSQTHVAAIPVLDIAPTLLSPSHHSIHQPSTTADMQPLDLTAVSRDDTLVEIPLVSAAQPVTHQPTNTEED